jgi:hypothetical protein
LRHLHTPNKPSQVTTFALRLLTQRSAAQILTILSLQGDDEAIGSWFFDSLDAFLKYLGEGSEKGDCLGRSEG